MYAALSTRQKFFGLLELDAAGTVLYSRPEKNGDAALSPADLRGRNFFREVAAFKNVEEFQQCLNNFSKGFQRSDSIFFTCLYDDGPLEVKILLARIPENSGRNTSKTILLHIRQARLH